MEMINQTSQPERLSEEEIQSKLLSEKEQDSLVPTFEVTLSPEEADAFGAFTESALTYDEAKAASPEILEVFNDADRRLL